MKRQKQYTKGDLQTRRRKWRSEQIFAMVVACIPLVGFLVFNGYPLIISFIGMFCNVDLYDLTKIQWNDFEGFKSVFIPNHAYELFYFDLAKYFYKACVITLWIATTQLVTLGIALFIATLLREKPKGTRLFQTLFFIPYICSTVAVSLMWRWILDWDGGILNSILGTNIKWLENPNYITWSIIISIIWQAPGYGIVMYKAAFSNINNSLYEAADLDGANAWHRFWHLTVPMVSPVIFYNVIMGIIGNLQGFSQSYLMTGGGPNNSSLFYMLHLYRNAFQWGRMGYACAMAWVLFLVIAVFTAIAFFIGNKKVYYEGG